MNNIRTNGLFIRALPFWRSKFAVRGLVVLLTLVLVMSMMRPASAAIAFRSASSADNGTGDTTLTISTPTGATIGDVLILSIDFKQSANLSGPGAGWTPIQSTSAVALGKRTFYTVLTSTPAPSYVVTFENASGLVTTKASGGIIAYSGVDTSNPIADSAAQSNTSNSTTMTAPSVNALSSSHVVAVFGSGAGGTVVAASGMTLRYQATSAGGGGGTTKTTSGGQDIPWSTAGATGTLTATSSASAPSVGHSVALRPAPVVSQVGYRWFANNTSAGTVGSPLANQDTTATAPPAGQPFRLRMLLGVAELQLSTTTAYKLQYKWQATGTCDATGSFSDITASTPIKYYDNTGVSDAASIVTNGSDPVRSGVTKVTQTYEELNNFTVATAIPVNQDGMWDFALTLDTSASSEGTYCLRAVNANGSPLPTYSQIPSISALAPASKVVQGSYRLSQNANSLTPGSSLAATDTSTTLGATNDTFRLRATAKGYQGFSQVTSGTGHTCGIASDNQAYCWGADSSGQLGNGATTGNQDSPVVTDTSGVLSGKTILSIKAGDIHTCAIASDNQAYCWGADSSGQLGNGATTGNQVSPVAVDTSGVLSGKNILSISVGSSSACVIASDNQAYCWGDDFYGQLGNGATTGTQVSPVAVDTTGVLSGKTIMSISVGSNHACAIASDNQAYCWGRDAFGQLGNGATTGDQVSPVAVDTSGVLSGKTVSIISASSSNGHTCAIASDNLAYCWGNDGFGQIGDGATTGPQVSPVAVDTSGILSGKTILSISTGSSNACATASDNQAYCWGNDSNGQLGDGATTGPQVSPVAVDTSGLLSGKTIVSVSAGISHSCAITYDNQAYCWGSDSSSQLGNGSTTGTQVSPVAVNIKGALFGKTILSIAAGSSHTCAIASDNLAYCWGDDAIGQLGNGAPTGDQISPVAVDTSGVLSGKTILSIAASNFHTCVIASDNLAYCWGNDSNGQLGNGATTGNQVSPVAVDTTGVLSGKTILSISAGSDHTCVIASDNQAYCWGYDLYGQLGNGTTTGTQASPVAVNTSGSLSGKTILKISLGGQHACVIASDNQTYCWGWDFYGQVGNGATTGIQESAAVVDASGVLSGKTILSITAGNTHTCAVASDNLVYCWGRDNLGQVGNGATTGDQVSPVAVDTSGVLSGKTILSVSTEWEHTCVIASDNQVYCWGDEAYGKLGNGGATTGDQVSPVAVDTSGFLSGKTILSIFAGNGHTCAVASDNRTYCWGSDANGQLGNGSASASDQTSPFPVERFIFERMTLNSSRLNMVLQFAQKTLASCSVQTGFAAITTSTAVAFTDNASATSGAVITTSSANDPTSSGGNTAQTYHDLLDTISNPSAITGESSGLWDFSLRDNGAPASTTYCIRLASSDGTAFGSYESYPEITTASGGAFTDPQGGLLRGGQSVVNGIKNLFSW